MTGYLIAEEGPLSGLIIRFEEGSEWALGRDPDEVGIVLEDPMVSRKHVVCRKTPEGYVLENLSSVNPATQNGNIIAEPVLLSEGDIVQIGNTFFRFTEKAPIIEEEPPSPPSFLEEAPQLSSLNIDSLPESRWMLKVVSGPNSGAEFHMQAGSNYVIGKDSNSCDVVFQDLSVSRQHARISVDEKEEVFIEDLGSRNGTFVNGSSISGKHQLASQDLVALGTTTFLVIDREQAHETIVSAAVVPTSQKEVRPSAEKEALHERNWRDIIISKKHLVVVGIFGFIFLISFVGMVSLFQSQPVVVATKHESEHVEEIIKNYSDVQFSYNEGSGKLFLTGHVLTTIEKQELMYQLRGLPFLSDIEDAVVIDEYVWENLNALLSTNSDWQGITLHASSPGRFVLRGYLQTLDQAQALSDYLNINFSYLDRLDNQVVVENILMTEVESHLLEKGFNNVTYQLSNGELILAGRVDGKDQSKFENLVTQFKVVRGIRSLKNYVIYTSEDSSLVDLSPKYHIMGYSKKDGENHYVVINGRILTLGDILDGMLITAIQPNTILLEKDGLKFKINYNLQ